MKNKILLIFFSLFIYSVQYAQSSKYYEREFTYLGEEINYNRKNRNELQEISYKVQTLLRDINKDISIADNYSQKEKLIQLKNIGDNFATIIDRFKDNKTIRHQNRDGFYEALSLIGINYSRFFHIKFSKECLETIYLELDDFWMIIVDNKTEDIYSVELEWSVSRSYNSGNHQFGTMGNTITEVLSIPNVNVSQLDKIQFKECRKFTP